MRSGSRGLAFLSLVVAAAGARAQQTAIEPARSKEEKALPFFVVAVTAKPDSAVRLTRFALGAIKGQLQPPKVQRGVAILSTRYMRDRRSGGHTEYTVIAAIDGKMKDSSTHIELSAWAIDVEPTRTGLSSTGRSARDLPTLTTTSPTTMSPIQQQPYRLAPGDDEWHSLEEVLYSFLGRGARIVPIVGKTP